MRRAEEVGPEDGLGSSGGAGDGVHIERRGVRREHRSRLRDPVETAENLLLDRHVLEDRFHQEIRVAELFEPGGAPDAAPLALRFRRVHPPPAHGPREASLDGGRAPRPRLVRGLEYRDRDPRRGDGHRDPAPHGSEADDRGASDLGSGDSLRNPPRARGFRFGLPEVFEGRPLLCGTRHSQV